MRNDRPNLYNVAAHMNLRTSSAGLGSWSRDSSGVGGNSRSVCLGKTVNQSSPVNELGRVRRHRVPRSVTDCPNRFPRPRN